MTADNLDLAQIATNFILWYDDGAYTPFGKVFDIGGGISRAITRLKAGISPVEAGGASEKDNGNGSLMRIAPLLFYVRNKPLLQRYEICKHVSSITHAHPVSVIACFIFLEFSNLLLAGKSKMVAYNELKEVISQCRFLQKKDLARFDRRLKNNITEVSEIEIHSTGYVIDTLEAALWSFLTTKNYRDAVLKGVNLGEDTDTVGAVAGALAGLYYGLEAIPKEWLSVLLKSDYIRSLAKEIYSRFNLRKGIH